MDPTPIIPVEGTLCLPVCGRLATRFGLGGEASRGVVLLLVLAALGLTGCGEKGGCRRAEPVVRLKEEAPQPVPQVSAFRQIVKPTDQQDLDPEKPGVFQPTAAGGVQSALYGSVRTTRLGNGLVPSFHEGIDIAPTQRDAHGLPTDPVRAVADGTVAYINSHAGNSNYGNYVVLTHRDPLGELYTLYAHLAAIAPGLRPGEPIRAGTTLGLMGHTPTTIVPAGRAHLHFEVGLIANSRFGAWFRAQRMTPDHGAFNGINLQGLNPLVFFGTQAASGEFEFDQFLREVPTAFEVLVSARAQWDYFRRYPKLWAGPDFGGGCMVLSCSENGTVLTGRTATPDEIARAGGARRAVLSVNEKALGRNGSRLVVRDNGVWRLGQKSEQWLEILEY